MGTKSNCISHKKVYITQALAEEALLEAHQRNYYRNHSGPVNVYACSNCGYFHLTSKGEMNSQLKEMLASGTLLKMKEANYWESKLKKR